MIGIPYDLICHWFIQKKKWKKELKPLGFYFRPDVRLFFPCVVVDVCWVVEFCLDGPGVGRLPFTDLFNEFNEFSESKTKKSNSIRLIENQRTW